LQLIAIWLPWTLRLVVLVVLLWVMLRAYRAIASVSPWAGPVVAAGLAGRAALGCLLFFVSYLDLPLLQSLHTGDGFWNLAPDARLYFDAAIDGVRNGPWTIPQHVPSPNFVAALSAWMWLVGVSPAAGALLNICAYLLTCWVLARILRHDQAAALIGITAFTFSPALVVFGSQSLKDGFFAGVVACICAGAWRLMAPAATARPWKAGGIAAAVVILLGLFVVAGIRTYYALFLWGALTIVLLGNAAMAGSRGRGLRLATAVLFSALAWTVLAAGAGARYDALVSQFVSRSGDSSGEVAVAAVGAFDGARDRFIASGGNTNIGGQAGHGVTRRALAIARGLLLVFVPATLLSAAGLVHFRGGAGGAVALADLDTLYVVLSLLAVLLLAWRRWRARELALPYALFILLVAVPTALGLAYVVTNFGTLFRLRLLVSVPFWMLVLAAARPAGGAAPGGRA